MLTIAFYLLKVMLCSAIFIGYYWLVLRNKKFHVYNRFYLLASVVLSWVIPLLKIDFWQNAPQQPQAIKLLTIVATGERYIEEAGISNHTSWDWNLTAVIAFSLISAMFLISLVTTIIRVWLLISKNRTEKLNNIDLVFTNAKGTPFSFFKYIFWNENIDLTSAEGEHILKHELAHVNEKHSADKLFMNLVLIAGWYNPFLWLIKKELNIIHEFVADEKAIKDGDTSTFAAMLLKAVYPQFSFPLANSFFHSPLKRRLLMLTSFKKTRFAYLRRLAILPLLMFTCMLVAFSFKKDKMPLFSSPIVERSAGVNSEGPDPANIPDTDLQDTTAKKKQDKRLKENDETVTMTGSFEITVKDSLPTMSFAEVTEKERKELIVLDGKFISWDELKKLLSVPSPVISMTVLKPGEAMKKYGEKGRNGIIEITPGLQEKVVYDQPIKEFLPKYDKVFTRVENPPYYKNGMGAFAEYINSNTQYPKEAIQNKVEGAVLIQFIVNNQGELTDFKKLSDKGFGLEEEAIRLIKNSGEWKPGVQNGNKVPVQIQQQVIFELPKNT